jgi:hypothetical protein
MMCEGSNVSYFPVERRFIAVFVRMEYRLGHGIAVPLQINFTRISVGARPGSCPKKTVLNQIENRYKKSEVGSNKYEKFFSVYPSYFRL